MMQPPVARETSIPQPVGSVSSRLPVFVDKPFTYSQTSKWEYATITIITNIGGILIFL